MNIIRFDTCCNRTGGGRWFAFSQQTTKRTQRFRLTQRRCTCNPIICWWFVFFSLTQGIYKHSSVFFLHIFHLSFVCDSDYTEIDHYGDMFAVAVTRFQEPSGSYDGQCIESISVKRYSDLLAFDQLYFDTVEICTCYWCHWLHDEMNSSISKWIIASDVQKCDHHRGAMVTVSQLSAITYRINELVSSQYMAAANEYI